MSIRLQLVSSLQTNSSLYTKTVIIILCPLCYKWQRGNWFRTQCLLRNNPERKIHYLGLGQEEWMVFFLLSLFHFHGSSCDFFYFLGLWWIHMVHSHRWSRTRTYAPLLLTTVVCLVLFLFVAINLMLCLIGQVVQTPGSHAGCFQHSPVAWSSVISPPERH